MQEKNYMQEKNKPCFSDPSVASRTPHRGRVGWTQPRRREGPHLRREGMGHRRRCLGRVLL